MICKNVIKNQFAGCYCYAKADDIFVFHPNTIWNKKCKAQMISQYQKESWAQSVLRQLNWQAHVYSNYWIGVQFNYSSKETSIRLAIGSKTTTLMKTKRHEEALHLSFNSISSFLLLLGQPLNSFKFSPCTVQISLSLSLLSFASPCYSFISNIFFSLLIFFAFV